MGNILTAGKNALAAEFEENTCGGNEMWANPEEARKVGAQILSQLCERRGFEDERSETPQVPAVTKKIFSDALEVINYAALPTERRANILHGLIDAAAESGVLGGKPEWAPAEMPTPTSQSFSDWVQNMKDNVDALADGNIVIEEFIANIGAPGA